MIETKEIQGTDRSYVKTILLFQDIIHGLVKLECPDILYQGQQIKESELIRVVKSYNECIKSPYEMNIISKKRNSMHFYLQGGYQQMKMQLPTYNQKVEPSGVQYNEPGINTTVPVNYHLFLPTLGVEWHLTSLSDKLALSMEVSQFKVSNTLSFHFDNYNYQKDFDDGTISHEYRLFRISPAVKFYLNNSSRRPYLKLGLAFYSVQNEKSYLAVRSEVTISLFAFGIDIPVFQKLKAFAELKAENM
ncbi:hypothetical protein [Runella sp.]|uniref:hypothetical protein n=1 Tax=Runella sp. TaxID=1960881 RepID=UPI002620F1B3|nr:hypothetical protein [Runella sp.]